MPSHYQRIIYQTTALFCFIGKLPAKLLVISVSVAIGWNSIAVNVYFTEKWTNERPMVPDGKS
jgi:hypothetical protein